MDNKFTNIKERILFFAKNQGVSYEKFSESIGMTYGNFKGENKNRPINSDALENILTNYPNVNPIWLLTGIGEMLKEEAGTKNDVVAINDGGTLPSNRKTKDRIYDSQEIPFYDIEVAAGLKDIFDNRKSQRILDTIRIPGLPKCDGALPATGDSMYPLLKSGDLVCFRRSSFDSIFWGEMYILDLQIDDWDTMLTVKFIQKSDKGDNYVKLVSHNQHHQPKDVNINQIRAIAMVKATIRINSMV